MGAIMRFQTLLRLLRACPFLLLVSFGFGRFSPALLAQSNPQAYFSLGLSGFFIPSYETFDLSLDRGLSLGFGPTIGVQLSGLAYAQLSVSYLRRSASQITFSSSFVGGVFRQSRTSTDKSFPEVRLDFGPLTRLPINEHSWLNAELGITYLSLSLGSSSSIDSGTPFWGGYLGVGFEYLLVQSASLELDCRYRHLQKNSADFGGIQCQIGFRYLLFIQ
jgi:hypothetical protein